MLSLIRNGPLVTLGFRFSDDFKMTPGSIVLKWCAGSGASKPSTHSSARKGAKGRLRWKVIERWSAETSAELIRFRPEVKPALNLGLLQSRQVKSTSRAS